MISRVRGHVSTIDETLSAQTKAVSALDEKLTKMLETLIDNTKAGEDVNV